MIDRIAYLLHADEPWVRYRTLVDLLGVDQGDPVVLMARQAMLEHPLVKGLMAELKGWPGIVLNSHKSAGQCYHKLAFLAEIGVLATDGPLAEITTKIRQQETKDGIPTLSMQISESHGGTGTQTQGWALCDAPVTLSALAGMGLDGDLRLRQATESLLRRARDNGWPCAVSPTLGTWRGPGKIGDPCPYANLAMLQLLAACKGFDERPETQAGVECLLGLWEKSRERHPYIFYMGIDFRKLKVPFIWYDILHVADVLSRFDQAIDDPRFCGMLGVITAKADADGLYAPESEWQAWREWPEMRKGRPSTWLTFLVMRLEKRAGIGFGRAV